MEHSELKYPLMFATITFALLIFTISQIPETPYTYRLNKEVSDEIDEAYQLNNEVTEFATKQNEFDYLRYKDFDRHTGEPIWIYDKDAFRNKLKNISAFKFVNLLENAKYTNKIDYADPNNLLDSKEINCQGLTLAIIDYIETNYELPDNFVLKAVMSVGEDTLHVYPMIYNKSANDTTLLDVSIDRDKGIEDLTNLLTEFDIYRRDK